MGRAMWTGWATGGTEMDVLLDDDELDMLLDELEVELDVDEDDCELDELLLEVELLVLDEQIGRAHG